jgi:integrase
MTPSPGLCPSGDLVFTGMKGGALRAAVFRHAAFNAAAEAAGAAGLHPHELRHTAASLAIAAGADVKVVQQMLGHKSATMTLDLYGHLFPTGSMRSPTRSMPRRVPLLVCTGCVPGRMSWT